MDVRFIGTGSGKVSRERFHSSLMISVKDYKLLVDAGDSVARALLYQDISVNSINGIIISHLHPDHFSGFASLIVQMQMNDRQEPLFVFIHQTLIPKVKEFLTLSYIFMERMKFPLQFIGFDTEAEISISPLLSFISRQNTHLDEYQKYDPELSYISGSFLFKSGEKIIYYSGDLGSPDDLYLFNDHKTGVFITEAAHVDLESILKVSEKLNPGKIILTHLEAENIRALKRNIESIKNHNIVIAEDGLKISV